MSRARGTAEVLAAAAAFGAGIPAAKVLLAGLSPAALAGGLYLAAGAVLALVLAADRRRARSRLGGSDRLALAIAIATGGILGPLALFAGLARVPAYAASLLLTLEGPLTIAIAVGLGHERLGGRGWAGAAAVVAGGMVLAPGAGPAGGNPVPLGGALLVALACLAWAADNNLTRQVSAHDARRIAAMKGLAGGGFLLALAALRGELGGAAGRFDARTLAAVVAVGAVSYGLSLVLFIRGLRRLGVTLTSALFATAPGAGVLLAWLGLGEQPGRAGLAALALMSGGAVALALDVHAHAHRHEPGAHTHPHEHDEHDEHHRHDHTPDELAARPHNHLHTHAPLVHAHPHAADTHHRHRHGS